MTPAGVGSALAGPVVRLHDVFVALPGAAGAVMALRGADLTVAAGERLLVQGPNGAGKSTLLRVITGEQPVVAGTARVGGSELHRLSAAARRRWRARQIGYVDQHARRNLLPELSVLDNVALHLTLTGTPPAHARRRAAATLADLGLSALAGRRVQELSGGEAQRVAVCAAVAHAPRLLLADEPTGELDRESAVAVYAMLGRVAAGGAGVVLVSHDPGASDFADRVVGVREGRVAEQWAPGSEAVHQLPDASGWVRLPPELMPPARAVGGLVASVRGRGVLLTPRPGPPEPPDSLDSPAPASQEQPVLATPAAAARASAEPGDDPPLVQLAEVAVGRPGRCLFAGLDRTLRRGDWLVVTGRSGSGKSTLLSLVVGLADPDLGQVLVGGASWSGLARGARAEHRRRWLAFAPQRPALLESLSVRENLAVTAAVRRRPAAVAEAVEVAERLRLGPLLDQPVERLSGGERQRVALARCLMSTAPVLVLDEPTSQQDEASAALVLGLLREQQSKGRVLVTSSHDPRLSGRDGLDLDVLDLHALDLHGLDLEGDAGLSAARPT